MEGDMFLLAMAASRGIISPEAARRGIGEIMRSERNSKAKAKLPTCAICESHCQPGQLNARGLCRWCEKREGGPDGLGK